MYGCAKVILRFCMHQREVVDLSSLSLSTHAFTLHIHVYPFYLMLCYSSGWFPYTGCLLVDDPDKSSTE